MSAYDKDILLASLLAGAATAVCLSGAGLLVVGLLRLVMPRNFKTEGEFS